MAGYIIAVTHCKRGTAQKKHTNQPIVAADLCKRIGAGDTKVTGVMLESFLLCGNQKIGPNMMYGMSVTDACMDWSMTEEVLKEFAKAVKARREVSSDPAVDCATMPMSSTAVCESICCACSCR